KYLPCFYCDCTGNRCKKSGETIPYEWPDLLGVEIMRAKATVESTNSNVTAVPLDYRCLHIWNTCCNRVWLCPDAKGRVREIPMVG
ncbi:hypothetical protein A4A49_61514, partial [Nicotiana attenuata]